MFSWWTILEFEDISVKINSLCKSLKCGGNTQTATVSFKIRVHKKERIWERVSERVRKLILFKVAFVRAFVCRRTGNVVSSATFMQIILQILLTKMFKSEIGNLLIYFWSYQTTVQLLPQIYVNGYSYPLISMNLVP